MSAEPAQRTSIWRSPGLARLITSITISQLGTAVTGVALPIFLLDRFGLGLDFGLTLGIRLIPNIMLGTVVSEVVRRWDPRKVSVLASVFSALIAVAFPFTDALWQVQALSFLIGLTTMFLAPARLALRTRVTPQGRELEANGLIVTAQRVASLLGPVVVGPVLAFSTISVLFFAEAATALIAALLLAGPFPGPREDPAHQADAPPPRMPKSPLGILRRLFLDNPRDLFAIIRGDGMVFGLTLTAFTYVFVVGMNSVFVPAFARIRFPEIDGMLGYLIAAMGLGGAAGGILAGRLTRFSPGLMYILGNVLEAVCWLLLLFAHQPVLAIALLVAGGILESVATAVYMAEVQARFTERELTHYYSMLLPSNDVFVLLGATVAGLLVAPDRLGVSIAVIAGVMAIPILLLTRSFFTPRPQPAGKPAPQPVSAAEAAG
ncbi:MFS transporter [Actinoplanes sp. TFC3]|uniref:MFS transporter n=1 Tax=Actinoplanes sp. TFC3 TaxID=1710355 RepID=UPI0008343E47|nr:MFS transporter [Actinoplanes sp. TFC3]